MKATDRPQSAIRNPQSGSGFTLLELLVAMALMTVIASCLYTALHTGFRAYGSAAAAVEPTSLALNAIELLKQDILGVLPPGSGLAGAFVGTNGTGLKGVDNDQLAFYTTHVFAQDDQIAGGLGQIELLLEEDPDEDYGNCLLLRRVTTNLLAPRDVEPVEQVLCRHVVSLNLRYYDGEAWVDNWDSTADANSLPLAVEVEIELALAHNGPNGRNGKEPQKRRLRQSFVIPCEAAAAEEESTSTP